MEYYSVIERNKSESILVRWMKLKAILQSEVEVKKKKTLYINTRVCVCVCVCALMLSHFSCVWFSATLWTVAHQAPLSMGFSRQEDRNGLPCPPPGIGPTFLMYPALAGSFFTPSSTWEAPHIYIWNLEKWYCWNCVQGRDRGADIENGFVDTTREGEGETNWESSIETYTCCCC